MEIEQNVALANFSTLKVGGPADFYARVVDLDELEAAYDFAQTKNIPILILGGGSNILFADAGFRGLVVKNEITGIEFSNNSAKVGAGESLANLLAQTAEKNLAGLVDLAGVPGTVGGAVVGHQIEKNRNQQDAYRIQVRLERGGYQTVTQGISDLRVGDRVRIQNNQVTRY